MSTATASQNITHLPRTAHPLPLREQAFTLHCQGLRSPAIAQALGVPERTIRAWIAAALDDLKDDMRLSRREQLLLAVERQHTLTAAAWQQFHREAAARDALLDAALESLRPATSDTPESSPNAAGTAARPVPLHLPASTPAPRYLSLILQANKEANRLLGLHTLARLHLLATDTPEADPTDSHIPAKTATATPSLTSVFSVASVLNPRSPAESATASAFVGASGGRPECLAERFPAESATAPIAPSSAFRPSATRAPALQSRDSSLPAESATDLTPPLSVSSVSSVVQSRIPAKTATAPTPTPTPAHRPHHARRAPQPWMM